MWIAAFFIGSLFASKKYKRKLAISGGILLYIYFTDFLSAPIYRAWEYPMVWYRDVPAHFEAAIVLGGVSAPGKKPDDRTHFPGSPDRLMHALQLYKLGKVKKIIISGGSGNLVGKQVSEAHYLVNVLKLCGVDAVDILFDARSRNTRENALYSKEIISSNFKPSSQFLLVTSSYHMKRSVACFKKVGINVTAFPVDSRVNDESSFISGLVPNPVAPLNWDILIHELFGYASYRVAGYL